LALFKTCNVGLSTTNVIIGAISSVIGIYSGLHLGKQSGIGLHLGALLGERLHLGEQSEVCVRICFFEDVLFNLFDMCYNII
jgi:hypothetical protein